MKDLRLIIYDRVCPSTVAKTWGPGARLYKLFGRVDDVYGASSWPEAFNWLAYKGHTRPIKEVQFWGHGGWGFARIGGDRLSAQRTEYKDYLRAVKDCMLPDGIFWFRTCQSFGSSIGQNFAKFMAKELGCTVAGHTYLIHLWHSGLRTFSPDQWAFDWSAKEGLKEGLPAYPTVPKKAAPWAPRTISFLNTRIPSKWIQPLKRS